VSHTTDWKHEIAQDISDYIDDLNERIELLENKNAYLMTRCQEAEAKIDTFKSLLKDYS